MSGFICSGRIYKYKNWLFEITHFFPHPLKVDYEPRKRVGKKFWDMYKEFDKLSDEEQSKYRIGGGCERI